MEEDHYDVLGLSDDQASEAEIKKAFRTLAREVHPDKNPGISPDVYRKVQRARDVLLNPALRKAHNISRSHRMKNRNEGVSKGRVHKGKDEKSRPGTFFKSKAGPSKGAAGSPQSEFKKFTQDARDKKKTPNFAGNAQSNPNQFSSRPEAEDKKETPNFGANAQSTKYNFPDSHGTRDTKNDPNFARNARSTPYSYSFDKEDAKDKKETPNFGANAQSTQYNFPDSHGTRDTKNDPNFARNARSTPYSYSFDKEGAKDKKETPNFGANAQSTQHNFPDSHHDAGDTKNDPNFARNARSTPYSYSFDKEGAKDKKETPNFEDYAKRFTSDYFFRPDYQSNEETTNSAEHAKRSKHNFPFGSPNAEGNEETPNFPRDAQGNEEKKWGFGAEPMDEEDIPHKEPFAGRGAQAAGGTRSGPSTRGVDDTSDEPFVHEVLLTLEDVANGCTKTMHFSRPIILADGTVGKEEIDLSFVVKKGWKAGSKVTFGKAAQPWKDAERDIVFIMKDAPHPIFTRAGSDLLYTANVNAAQIELGSPIRIPTLGGGTKSLIMTPEFINNPDLLKRIKGEGLPLPKEPTKKGDLLVKFVFPS